MLSKNDYIKIDAQKSSLIFKKESGRLLELYYGEKIKNADDYSLFEGKEDYLPEWKQSNLHKHEFSYYGNGDFKLPSLLIKNADGWFVNKFAFIGAQEVETFPVSPMPLAKKPSQTVKFTFKDEVSKVTYNKYYSVFDDCDTVCSFCEILNDGENAVTVKYAASLTLDLYGADFTAYNYLGAWARERHEHETRLTGGIFSNQVHTGASSPFRNPFTVLKDNQSGEFYGFNIIYSGNHKTSVEVSSMGVTRVNVGINDFCFEYELNAGESFLTPQAVMVRGESKAEITAQMHAFVTGHILPERFLNKPRPIVYNNWEGTYFGFDNDKLTVLAERAAQAGAELFVLDDGWFGKRDDDRSGLGDWFVNEKKLKGGLKVIADKVHSLGLKFGLWFEPEMVNPDSELYRQHPEWAMQVPQKTPLETRNQLMLDLCNPAVVSYIKERLGYFIETAGLDYIKWDFNRFVTDPYSSCVKNAGEYDYRYYAAFYDILQYLTDKYPQVLIEGCASGGARFDLGVLYYSPQIWCSDDSDARERLYIQEGTLVAYPQSTVSAHVSICPNHQTGNSTSIESRFNVALTGSFGYELDWNKVSSEELKAVRAQTDFYKKYRDVIAYGDYYALGSAFKNDVFGWIYVAKDKSKAVAVMVKNSLLTSFEMPEETFFFKGLDQTADYRVTLRAQANKQVELNKVAGGDLLCRRGLKLGRYFKETDRAENSASIYTAAFVFEKV